MLVGALDELFEACGLEELVDFVREGFDFIARKSDVGVNVACARIHGRLLCST